MGRTSENGNNVKLRCWPMMAQIVADPTTMAGVVYLNGEILSYNVVEKDTSNRLVIAAGTTDIDRAFYPNPI